MPNSYKSVAYSTTGSGSNEDVYTCGVVASVVKSLVVYNSSPTTAYAITVKIYKAASTTSYEVNYQSVGARTAWNVLSPDGSINLQNGDKIQVVTSQAGLVVNLSYMESSVSVSGINLASISDVSDVAATDNQVLTWDSATGLATWEAATGGVTSVVGTSPISVSGTSTRTVSISEATTSVAGSMSAADKVKLNGIATAADVNQNAFSNINALGFQADGTTAVNLSLAADNTTDTFQILFAAPLTLASASGGDPAVDAIIVGTTAEANVNADWNAVSGDAQILNKPTIVSSVTGTAPIVSSGGTTPAISITAATTSAAGSMSSSDKTKLDGVASGAEVNQNAFSNFAVSGQTTIASASKTGTLEFIAGGGISFITDNVGKTLQITNTGLHKQITGKTVATGAWSLVSGLYEASISDGNILSTSIVDVIPSNASISVVKAAEMLPQTDSSAGAVKIYATNLPTASITVTLNIHPSS
jgi:hypothetical protein